MVSLAIVAAVSVADGAFRHRTDRERLVQGSRRQLRAAVVRRCRMPRPPAPRRRRPPLRRAAPDSEAPTELPVEDPLADALAAIRGETQKSETGGAPAADSADVDPLADVMADIRAKGSKAEAVEARAATLPFGGDKWGRDVLKKVIKGSETSIFVGFGRRGRGDLSRYLVRRHRRATTAAGSTTFSTGSTAFSRRYRICC